MDVVQQRTTKRNAILLLDAHPANNTTEKGGREMTQEQKEQVATHFGELYSIAIGLTPNIPDDISEAMKTAYMAGADYAIDMFAMNWISVEDELPEVYEPVLAAAGNHFAVVAIRDNFDWYDSKFAGGKLSGITHWQHFPQPPSSSEKPNNFKKGGGK